MGLRGEEVLEKYPHQLSGGQSQRMMMARVHLIRPKEEDGISFIYITHDLSTAYQVGDNIVILYKGKIVESGETTKVIDHPEHPYVKLLIDSIPTPDPEDKWSEMINLPEDVFNREKAHN